MSLYVHHDKRRPIRVCQECHEERPHEAKGLCGRCYNRNRKTPRSKSPSQRTRYNSSDLHIKEAIGVLLPIPPMVRCGGCADVPACDRAALPGVGYCLRCRQERAREVAA